MTVRVLKLENIWRIGASFLMSFFFKVLNGFVNIDISPLIDFYSHSDRYSLRDRDSFKELCHGLKNLA